MKFSAVPAAVLGLIISLAGFAPANDDKKALTPSEKIERSTPADPMVTVTLCVMSGKITVRGWDKNEVRARSLDVEQIEFRRIDKAKDSSKPATRIDVMVLDKKYKLGKKADCQALADVDMDVPQGATVQVQTRDGDIRIVGVSAAYAGSQNGDIVIERAAKLVEAGSVGGSISLKDSTGRINLSSAGGGVEVANVRPSNAEDIVEVGTVSGDIRLDRVTNPKVMAKTVNGNVTMTGALTRAGYYGFTSMGGDVLLAMPHDASFKLNAKISEGHDLVSDFPLKYVREPPPPAPTPKAKPAPESVPKIPAPKVLPSKKGGPIVEPVTVKPSVIVTPYSLHRVIAICGSGDATITVASFGGTLRLKKM